MIQEIREAPESWSIVWRDFGPIVDLLSACVRNCKCISISLRQYLFRLCIWLMCVKRQKSTNWFFHFTACKFPQIVQSLSWLCCLAFNECFKSLNPQRVAENITLKYFRFWLWEWIFILELSKQLCQFANHICTRSCWIIITLNSRDKWHWIIWLRGTSFRKVHTAVCWLWLCWRQWCCNFRLIAIINVTFVVDTQMHYFLSLKICLYHWLNQESVTQTQRWQNWAGLQDIFPNAPHPPPPLPYA